MQKNNAFKEYLRAKLTTTMFLFYFYYKCCKSKNIIQGCIYFDRNAVLLKKCCLVKPFSLLLNACIMQLLREVWFMLETFHYFVSIFVEISKLIFAFNRLIQLFLSDIVPSS